MLRSHARSAIILFTLGAGLVGSGNAIAAPGKVTICHVPPGNARNAHTIEISTSAVSAHLAHGDYLGACRPPVCSPGTSTSCYSGPAGTAGVGTCHEGTQTCNVYGTAFEPCVGEVQPGTETCGDGLDNDCDGTSDEGCVCSPGSTAHCYDGPSGTAGVGACLGGTMTCSADGSGYGPCAGQILPAVDVCGDQIDNDCDGATDETCVCTPGTTAHCYDGPAGTSGVGACHGGTMTCDTDGSGFGPCTGEVTPAAEVCGDQIDNDCDGATDETCVCTPGTTAHCYDGPAGTAGVGACQGGTMTCSADGAGYGPCTGQVLPGDEVCGDGLDNDCDGVIDDRCVCEPGSETACYGGPPSTEDVGTCRSGTRVCNGDGTAYGACHGEVLPAAEVCGDGLDNDCDGVSDDGCLCVPLSLSPCYGGPPGTEGVGVCAAGVQMCNASGTSYGACIGDVVPSAEACGDALDNNCNGQVDEGCIGDRAWRDLDGDGIQDAGEPGLPGVTFSLRSSATAALVAVATSDLNGIYTFSSIPPGSYFMEVVPPAGYFVTTMDAGSDDSLDSDFDGETLMTPSFTLGVSNFDIDGGFTTGVALCGDGVVQSPEQCDGSDLGGADCNTSLVCPPGAVCDAAIGSLACTATCVLDVSHCQRCGDGVVAGTEQCDGTQLRGATCQSLGFESGSMACTSASAPVPHCVLDSSGCFNVCGNDRCNAAQGECQTCPTDCSGSPLCCGDGVVQPGEECDDGNTNPFDGCDQCILVDINPG